MIQSTHACDTHMMDLFIKANLFSLAYRQKYFMLNLVHRLISINDTQLIDVQRETRNDCAPLTKIYVPINDTVVKCPVNIA